MKYFKAPLGITFLIFILNGCSTPSQSSWQDSTYEEKLQTANHIFHENHPEQATKFYQEALQRAFLADDCRAIHDSGFNLALSYLAQKDNKNALNTVLKTEKALQTRQWSQLTANDKDDLTLLKATIFYHQKKWEDAKRLALKAKNSNEKAVSIESLYLQGLIAFEEKNNAQLNNILSEISLIHPLSKEDNVNMLELKTDQAILTQNWALALDYADTLLQERRIQNRYDAMRRAMILKETALLALGKRQDSDNIQAQIQDSLKND